MNQQLLFEPEPQKPRAKPRVMMHVVDAGPGDVDDGHLVQFECPRCGNRPEDWDHVRTVSEGKRGKPCPKCNSGAQ